MAKQLYLVFDTKMPVKGKEYSDFYNYIMDILLSVSDGTCKYGSIESCEKESFSNPFGEDWQ